MHAFSLNTFELYLSIFKFPALICYLFLVCRFARGYFSIENSLCLKFAFLFNLGIMKFENLALVNQSSRYSHLLNYYKSDLSFVSWFIYRTILRFFVAANSKDCPWLKDKQNAFLLYVQCQICSESERFLIFLKND